MNSFKMAYRLLKNNIEIYKLYLAILIVSVIIYYNFSTVEHNDVINELVNMLQATGIAITICKIILVLTLIFFITHANNFFLKQRQKEIGLYMLMGISNSQIAAVFAIEVLFLGIIALLIGITIGIIVSKLFFMMMLYSIDMNIEIPLTISIDAIVNVFIVFSILFIIFSIINYRKVKNSELINLIRKAKLKETVPKLKGVTGIISIILLIIAYIIGFIATYDNQKIEPFIGIISTIILTCIGTYLFYKSFLSIVFNKLIGNKQFIYKRIRLISFSNIFFRLNSNYKSLAITTLLVASTITACGVSLSFYKYNRNDALVQRPYSFSYIGNGFEEDIDNIINKSKHELINKNKFEFCEKSVEYLDGKSNVDYKNGCIITSYSEIKKALEFSSSKDEIKKPKNNEVIFNMNATSSGPSVKITEKEVSIDDNYYKIVEEKRLPIIGNIHELGKKNIYVLRDEQYENIKNNSKILVLNTYKISDENDALDLMNNIESENRGENIKLYKYVENFMWEHYAFGVFFFFGIIMFIIFTLASFSAIYFKILEDAIVCREQYKVLQKIGMNKIQIKKSIKFEVTITFILPSIIGGIHSIIAMISFQNLLNMKFPIEIVISITLFVIIMISYYKLICSKYFKLLMYSKS